MDKKQSLELCAALSNAKGAPGFEDEVLAVLRRYGEGLGSFREDSLRNLYLSRSGNQGGRPMVQLDAHTDEVAFMDQGVIVEQGPARQLMDHPREERTRQFLARYNAGGREAR